MSERKSNVGDPIWVESLMTGEEYAATAQRHPNTFSKGGKVIQYDPNFHKDGRWRYKMGASSTPEEIKVANKRLDELYKLLKQKVHDSLSDQGRSLKT